MRRLTYNQDETKISIQPEKMKRENDKKMRKDKNNDGKK